MDTIFEMLSHRGDHLIGRVYGPLNFRLFVMPLVVSALAIRAHLRDVREGRPTVLWAFIKDPVKRRRLLLSGLKDFGRVFIVACVLDTVYQVWVLRSFYLGEMLVVAVTCAVVPYFLFRGPVTRILRLLHRKWSGPAVSSGTCANRGKRLLMRIRRRGMRVFSSTMALVAVTAIVVSADAQESAGADSVNSAQDQTAELAKKAQNPVADLMIMPFQYNVDFGIGPADASRQDLKFMPIIPFSLGEEWNLITRTIIPWIEAESPVKGGEDKSGLGDIQQSFFFTPKKPVKGWVIGAGPILQYPSATDNALGSEKWSAGPSFIALQQKNGWTYGALANHVQSFAGNDERDDVSATFLQPFLSRTSKTFTTLALNTESIYDYENSQWTVPINISIGQMIKVGKRPISLELGYRHYAEAPEDGPEWGLRLFVKFLFPQ